LNYWITTHWPVPRSVRDCYWHVYLKDWPLVDLPQIGDVVLVYECKTATVHNERVHKATKCRGYTSTGEELRLPDGVGGIIGKMTVSGTKRRISHEDVLLDYGNLREWEFIIPCDKRCRCDRDRSFGRDYLGDLMEALGKPRRFPPMFLYLHRVPQEFVPQLLHRIGCNGCVGRA